MKGEYTPELDYVLDFLEGLGLLLHKNVFDKEMIWNSYYSCSIGYWFTANKRIAQVRKEDPAIWMEVEYLANTLLKIERKKAKKSLDEITPTEEWLQAFLIEESQLS